MTLHPEITLELAGPAQLEELLPLVAAYHAFEEVETSAEQRRKSVGKLLRDKKLGDIWLVRKLDASSVISQSATAIPLSSAGEMRLLMNFILKRRNAARVLAGAC